MKRILVIDDHEVVRVGLKYVIEDALPSNTYGDATNLQDGLHLATAHEWDIILLELSLDGNRGLELLKEIKRNRPKVPILVVTSYTGTQYALRAIKAGASGYINKTSTVSELINATQKVLHGERYISSAVAETLSADFHGQSSETVHELLSDREFQVMRLIGSGKTVGEIAVMLSISDKTVSTYRARILEKTHLKNNAEVVRYVVEQKLA